MFEDLDILGPEVKDLVSTNPKIGKAIVRLGDILKKKDHELLIRLKKYLVKLLIIEKTLFQGKLFQIFLQAK